MNLIARPSPALQLQRWLSSGHAWVTVVGEPGIGKTHLIDALRASIAAHDSVVVLDPYPAAGHALQPGERVIAVSTSRGLHPDEEVVEVLPLPTARASDVFRAAARQAGALQDTLSEDTVQAIAARVGGNPLAVRTVAQQTSVVTAEALLQRLDRPPRDGVDPIMQAHPPLEALRARLDALWEAQGAPEQALLQQLQVFSGRFTVSDIEAVCAPPVRLDLLQKLRTRSLLSRHQGALRLSPVVRRYLRAVRPLTTPEPRQRHRDHFAALAWDEVHRIRFHGASTEALSFAEADLRSILDAAPDEVSAAVCDIALALSVLYGQRSQSVARHRASSERALAAVPSGDARRRALAHLSAAHSAHNRGQLQRASGYLDEIRDLIGPPELEAAWKLRACQIATSLEDWERAEPLAAQARDAARRAQAPFLEVRILCLLGWIRYRQKRYPESIELLRVSAHTAEELGSTPISSQSNQYLCLAYQATGQLDHARKSGERALAGFQRVGNRHLEAIVSAYLGELASEQDRLDDAARHLQHALACAQAVGSRRTTLYTQSLLAFLCLERGELAEHARQLEVLQLRNEGSPHILISTADAPPSNMPLAGDIWYSRGRAAEIAGDLDAAADALREALACWGDGSGVNECGVHILLAQIALRAGNHEAAVGAWSQASRMAEALRLPGLSAEVALLQILLSDVPRPQQQERVIAALRAMGSSRTMRHLMAWLWPQLERDTRREALAVFRLSGPGVVLDHPTRAVRLPGGRWASLGRRRLLWTLLSELASSPRPLSSSEIIAAVWPGERMSAEAAGNRLYNAIALLRKAGLSQWLQHSRSGYALAPKLQRIHFGEEDLDALGLRVEPFRR